MNPTPSERLGPAGEAEWARLRRHLELAQGFWLGFVFTPSPPAATVLRRRTERYLQGRARTLALFQPEAPDQLRTVWRELHTPASQQAGCMWVEAVRADSPTQPLGPWTAAWEALFLALNEQRETLRRNLSGGLVLVGLPDLKPRARELASDLWSIRSLVVDVPGVAFVSGDVVGGVVADRDVAGGDLVIPSRTGAARRGLPLTPSTELGDLRDRLRQVERLLALDDTGEAVEVAREAVALAQRASAAGLADIAVALAWLSRAEEEHGDLTEAARHVEDALRVAGETVDRFMVYELLERAGEFAARRSDLRRVVGAYREAVAVMRQQLETDGETPEALRDLANALEKLSAVEFDAGYVASATTTAEEALSLWRRLTERSPNDPEALRELSFSLKCAASYRNATGDFRTAALLREEDLSLLRRLVEIAGHDPADSLGFVWGLWSLGHARRRLGDLAAARAAYEEALALSWRLAEAAGDDPGTMDLVSTGLEWLGDLHAQSGDTATGTTAYKKALRARRQLVEARHQDELAVHQFVRLGQLHRKLGDIEAAISTYEDALVASRREVEPSDQGPWDVKRRTFLLDLLGAARSAAGDVAGAKAAFEERLALERRLFDLYGATPRAIRILVDALTDVAHARRAAGDVAGADDAEQEAARFRERLE
ncbi:MAG: hypothetical protein ACRDZ4_17900 [Egibacteraceae bacterium]